MAYNYEAGYSKIVDRNRERAQNAIAKIMPDVYRDWLTLIEQNVRRIFNEAVDAFYSDYTPNVYDRSNSLYNLLQMKRGEDYIDMWFDTSKMTSFRNGYNGEDGLFDQVFVKGWHGGADHGDYSTFVRFNDDMSYEQTVFTPHPNPGTPFWREPVPYYTRWGEPARVAPISPQKNYEEKLSEYQTSQSGIYADYHRAWDQNKHKLSYNL